MKKYVVNVKLSNGTTAIVLAKAKNDFDLEDKMAKELKEIFDDMNFINGIEFEEISKKTFSKKESHWFVGNTYVSCTILEEML